MKRGRFTRCLHILVMLCLASPPTHALPIQKMHFQEAELFPVLSALAKKAGLNLILPNQGTLTTNRINLTLRQAEPLTVIDALLTIHGFTYEIEGQLLIVSTLAEDRRESGYKTVQKKVILKHILAEKTAPLLETTKPTVKWTLSPAENAIIFQGRSSAIEAATKLLEKIDSPPPQITLESQVIELSESASKSLGFTWGKQQGNFQFSFDPKIGKAQPLENLIASLSLLASEGKAKVLARPNITVIDHEEATIQIGDRVPYAVPHTSSSGAITWTVQYLNTGLALKVTPKTNGLQGIWVHIQPEVSAIKEWRTTTAGEFPVISTRNAETRVLLKNGETFAIGGLLSEENRTTKSGVPFLHNLPLLGHLFEKASTERTQTDILFLLTPHLVKP